MGGDGTVLFASWLFQSNVPPVIPFSLGSFGFLTPFSFNNFRTELEDLLTKGVRLDMRMRFRATVYRAIRPSDTSKVNVRRRIIRSGRADDILVQHVRDNGWESLENETGTSDLCESDGKPDKNRAAHYLQRRPVETFEFLNDLVIDRGPSPYVSMTEVFADNQRLTTAQADGLCISTPTGSTAYSLSAGGSLVHPDIAAVMLTPICPHTLSFRPMLIPDSMEVRIAVPFNSRTNAWASFDGRGRIELVRGDHIRVSASPYPFPTVSPETQQSPWFDAVSRTLNWNQRKPQKSFMVSAADQYLRGDLESEHEYDALLNESDSDVVEDFEISDLTPVAQSPGPSGMIGASYFTQAMSN